MEITYKLAEEQKRGTSTDEVVIEEHGSVYPFTIRQVKENMAFSEKAIKELTANANLQEAIANNVLNNNEDIKELSDEKLNAIAMYFEAKKLVKTYSDKCKEFDVQLGKDQENLKKIYAQFPELAEEPSAVVEGGEIKLNV